MNTSYPSNAKRADSPRKTKAHKGNARSKRAIRVPDRSSEELALAADLLEKVKDVPDVREDLCQQVKQQIAEGTYDTDERMDEAVERLVDELLADTDAEADLRAEPGTMD